MLKDLIKLGGSVLTDKTAPLTARSEAIERLSLEIRESVPTDRWRSGAGIVIVHGAGSFGHPRAAEAAFPALGWSDVGTDRPRPSRPASPPELDGVRGRVARIQADVRALHLELVWSLGRAGIPAVSIPGFSFLRVRSGRLERPDLTELLQAASQGFVPVTCGDVVLDAAAGPWIVSGDRVLVEIARHTAPEQITFVTDVDGVYDRDPDEEGARLLAALSPPDLAALANRLLPSSPGREPVRPDGEAAFRPDVTGAMAGKLRALDALARMGHEPFVLSGLVPGRLADRLLYRDVPGTRVLRSP